MSNPSPLQPQGAIDGAAPKSRVRITVLTILALHVVFVGGLLMQGCDRKGGASASGTATNAETSASGVTTLPPLTDTNYYTGYPGDTASGGAGTSATGTPGAGAGAGAGIGTPAGSSLGAAGTAGPGSLATGQGSSQIPPAPIGSSYTGIPAATSSTGGNAGYPGGPADNASLGAGAGTGTGGFAAPVTGGQTTEHVIKKGDLIRDLAKKYGVSEQAILDANPGVKPRNLKVGDKVAIPAPTASSAAHGTAASTGGTSHTSTDAPAAAGETYVVKQGDNLTKIAKQFGVSVKQIRAANKMKSDRLVPKQKIIIPAKTTARQEPATASPSI